MTPFPPNHNRPLLCFLAAAALVAGACLVRADAASERSSFGDAAASPRLSASDRGEGTAAPATPFTREQLLATLARDLSNHFNLEGDLQLELVRAWAPPARVASRWELRVLEYPSVAATSMLVRCRVLADATDAGETTFVLRAAHWRDGWTARQPLSVGATFDVSALETRRVDLFRERDVLPAAVGDTSFVFARAVPAGRLLTWRDISRRPLVKKGELVEVSAIDGLLVVTLKALAMENGAHGDTVTVRNPESRKDFAAKVVAENRVQVRF